MCSSTATATGAPSLIDDMEDGDSSILANDSRVGGWFLSADGSRTSTPSENAPPLPVAGGPTGQYIHVMGSGYMSWGASLSVAIVTIGGCYDASAHVGIKFSYKSSSKLYVSALTAGVAAAPEGQRNHWKKEIPAAADWTEATITWAELSQLGAWGAVVAWDATKIYGFDFSPDSAVKPISYDVSIDNLSFTP